MTNSWSLLFDELNMTNQDYWNEDGFSLTGNPGTASEDAINVFRGSALPGGMGNDHITFSSDGINAEESAPFNYSGYDAIYTSSTPWKYNEEEIVKELLDYIRGTYKQHYAANDQNLQTLDFIEAAHNDGEACSRDNIMKYVSRYDKKGTARRDIMKILHYAVLLMHFNDKNANRETYPQ